MLLNNFLQKDGHAGGTVMPVTFYTDITHLMSLSRNNINLEIRNKPSKIAIVLLVLLHVNTKLFGTNTAAVEIHLAFYTSKLQ